MCDNLLLGESHSFVLASFRVCYVQIVRDFFILIVRKSAFYPFARYLPICVPTTIRIAMTLLQESFVWRGEGGESDWLGAPL